ncbi:MAG: Cof-type HAD-IIB family hydrolase [Succinivibrio sp.]
MAQYTIDTLPVVKDKFKVIALDLDDTLLRSDKSISDNTITTLQKAQSQGFSIAIATGRHPKSAVLYMQTLGCLNENSYAVCFNGAGVVRLSEYVNSGRDIGFPMVYKETAPSSLIRQVALFAHDKGCVVHGYSVTRGLLVENHNPHTQREIDNGRVGFTDIDFTTLDDTEEFFKVLVVGPKETLDRIRGELPEEFTSFFAVVRSEANYLEFIPNHATKGTALAHLCEKLGYRTENAMAFGDAENDLAMIRTAGLGVAMKNGFDIVKREADVITLTNDEDGVAELVKKYLD